MKFALLTMAALVLVLCPVLSRAQDKETPSQSPGASQPTIKTKFDSVKDETTVRFDQLLVLGTETEKLLISVEAFPSLVVFGLTIHEQTLRCRAGRLLRWS